MRGKSPGVTVLRGKSPGQGVSCLEPALIEGEGPLQCTYMIRLMYYPSNDQPNKTIDLTLMIKGYVCYLV